MVPTERRCGADTWLIIMEDLLRFKVLPMGGNTLFRINSQRPPIQTNIATYALSQLPSRSHSFHSLPQLPSIDSESRCRSTLFPILNAHMAPTAANYPGPTNMQSQYFITLPAREIEILTFEIVPNTASGAMPQNQRRDPLGKLENAVFHVVEPQRPQRKKTKPISTTSG